MENERIETGYRQKQSVERNREIRRETGMLEMVVKDGNVARINGVKNRVNWKGRNVMERSGT